MTETQKPPITQEQFEKICSEIEISEFGLKRICENLGHSHQSIYDYMRIVGEPAKERYARAKETQAEFIAENMLEIADDGSNDLMTVAKGDLEYEIENKEVTNRSRLRIDTRKWLLSKLLPKKYGDHIAIEHSGEIGIADTLAQARKRANVE